MTIITLRYQITDHSITLHLDDNPPYKITSGQYVVSTKSWPKPSVRLTVSPMRATQAASRITILVKGEVPETIPQNDGVAKYDCEFEEDKGVKLTITVQGTRRAQATQTIYAIPGSILELAKLPAPKNPESGKPSTTTPDGPGGIRFPGGLDRIPKVELKESGSKRSVELDDLLKKPPR